MSPRATTTTGANAPIRPFEVHVPEAQLDDLRRRVAATQWPEKETVADQSQGVPLAMVQELARYWATDYDWRRCEATLKALPQFITEIDGLAIHFIHVRSRHEDALPLVVNHGWPGSIIEQLATGVGYAQEMANRPQTLYGIANSVSSTPVGVRTVMSASISRSS